MNICFCWYWDRAEQIYRLWRDGLRAAIEEIGKTNDVDIILGKHIPEDKYDFILLWGDSNLELIDKIKDYKSRKGICLSTDPQNFLNLSRLNVIYCESTPVYEAVRRQGIRAIKAFGTDTDFFSPTGEEKDQEYFYPATFSPWKRQSEIAYLKDRLLCIGTVQPDGKNELEACKKEGVRLEIGYFPAEHIRNRYRRAKKVIIPAIHGSERTVLEVMSMDILPEVTHKDNIKTYSYIQEYLDSGLKSPREFILKNYSHQKYAKYLLRGME